MDETLEKETGTLSGDNGEVGGGSMAPDEAISGSSSDSEGDDGEEELKLEALEQSLAENPSNYDAHVQYIQCLRKLGHIEKLRQARKSMMGLFPLSPNMWQEWAKDEISLNESSEANSTIEGIYEQGVREYLSVSLWCDYLNFVQEHDQSVCQCAPSGVLKMRELFECALTAAGLHIAEGCKIWDAYREFEQAIFVTIDDGNDEDKGKQINRIRALFHRQLAVPLVDMQSVLLSYRLWEAEQGNIADTDSDEFGALPPNVASAYRKALEMYSARAPYEDQLSKQDVTDSDRLQAFLSYVKFEDSSGDPARVQILYERAIADFPISSDLWMGYTSYLDKTLKVPSVLKDVYSRATRNCNWIGGLWVRYLLSLERLHASEKELSAVFEQSLQCGFSSIQEYLDLFLTRIDGLRRRMSSDAAIEDGLEYGLIRETFQHAADYLSPQLMSTEDLLRLHSYWARLEVKLGKDLTAACGVWESLIKRSSSMFEVWQAYIAMETEMGHINEARSIYKRSYSKRFTGTGSEDICHSWLRFEREFGSLDDFDLAMRKVMPRLEELRLFRAQQELGSVASLATQKDNSLSKKPLQKRKADKDLSNEQSPAKRQKDASKAPGEASRGDAVKELAVIPDAVTDEKLHASTSAMVVDNEKVHESQVGDSASKETNPNRYTDQCTAFVSNISLEANEDHLRKFFNGSAEGGVTAIRLLRDKFTRRSRGLAYVDFSDEEHLLAAIGKNKQKLLGQKLSVAKSDPKQSQKRASSHGHGGRTPSDSKSVVRKESTESSADVPRRGGHLQLKGKNTFAMPRNVAIPLGWSNKDVKESRSEENEEQLKSNDEFRKMLLKK